MSHQNSESSRRRSDLRRRRKQQDRVGKREARRKGDERRQQRIAAPLQAIEGQKKLATLDQFLGDYRVTKDVEVVPAMLDIVVELDLLRNQHHALAIAAAVTALTSMHEGAEWLEHPAVVKAAVICSKGSMVDIVDPSDETLETREENAQLDPAQVLQSMVWWMVTGDLRYAQEVQDQARMDPPNEEAQRIFHWYAREHADLQKWVDQQHADLTGAQKEEVNEEALEKIREAIPEPLRDKVTYILEEDTTIRVGILAHMDEKVIRRKGLKKIILQTSLPSTAKKIKRAVEQGGEP